MADAQIQISAGRPAIGTDLVGGGTTDDAAYSTNPFPPVNPEKRHVHTFSRTYQHYITNNTNLETHNTVFVAGGDGHRTYTMRYDHQLHVIPYYNLGASSSPSQYFCSLLRRGIYRLISTGFRMHTFIPFEQRISNTAGTFLTNDWNYRPQLLLFKDTRHKLDDYLGWPGYQSAAQAGCREANATYIQSEDKNTSIPPFTSDLNWDDYNFHDDKAGIKQQKRSNMIHVIPKERRRETSTDMCTTYRLDTSVSEKKETKDRSSKTPFTGWALADETSASTPLSVPNANSDTRGKAQEWNG